MGGESVGIGRRRRPYQVEAEIGRGGMGVVYRARDPKLERPVAVKVLPAEFATDPGRGGSRHRPAFEPQRLSMPAIGR